jgi:hypothetical protein
MRTAIFFLMLSLVAGWNTGYAGDYSAYSGFFRLDKVTAIERNIAPVVPEVISLQAVVAGSRVDFNILLGNRAALPVSSLAIYGISGKLINTLPVRFTGQGRVSWDLRNSFGHRVGSGIYVARMKGRNSAPCKVFAVIR